MGLSIGIVGLGQFGGTFARLFHAHPGVDRVALCDLELDRARAIATEFQDSSKFSHRDVHHSLADLLRTDVDAVAIITQPWLHAPQCIEALEAGKHVYSAVPLISLPDGDEILEWSAALVQTQRRSGLTYMLGETTLYRPEAMFCRRKAQAGRFGDFVYAEGEYFHDVDGEPSLRVVHARRADGLAGREWAARAEQYHRRGVRGGPMFYPTHSVSGPLSVMGSRALKVNAYGYANGNEDPYFAADAYSNEMALFQLDNGAALRILECREVAGAFHASETFRIMGTRGSFAEGHWRENFRTSPETAQLLSDEIPAMDAMRDELPEAVAEAFARLDDPAASHRDFAPRGHGGSHPYLVHEFVAAVSEQRAPACTAEDAGHYMAMGVAAHRSALAGGDTVLVPRVT